MTDLPFEQFRAQKKPILKKKPLSHEVNEVIGWLMTTLLFMLVGSGAFLLYGLSTSAQRGYSLVQAERQQDRLQTANRELTLKVLDAQSFQNLQGSEVFSGMVKP